MSSAIKKFNPASFDFEEVKENEKVKGQYIAKVNYIQNDGNKSLCLLCTPSIFISTYGLPKGDWIKEETQRAKLKIPLDKDDSKYGSDINNRLIKPMNELDDLIWNRKEEIMGKHAQKFKDPRTHQRIIKQNHAIEEVNSSDEEDEGPPPQTLPYMTVKLGMEWTEDGKCTGKLKIKTFRKEESYNEVTKKKETKREELFLDNIDQLEALGIYRSTIRLVIIPSKFYLMPKAYEPKFGLIWKAVQIEIEPSRSSYPGLSLNQDLFADNSDNDSDNDNDNDNDDNDDSDDQEKEPSAKTKGKKNKSSNNAEV